VHQYLVEYHFSDRTSVLSQSELKALSEDKAMSESRAAESLWNMSREALTVLQDKELETQCRSAMDQSVAAARARVQTGMSLTQQQVTEELRRLGLALEEESLDAKTGYSIDAVVSVQHGGLIAVEIDGPSHFAHSALSSLHKGSVGINKNAVADADSSTATALSNSVGKWTVSEVLGGTAMKKRHLARVGYAVVSVPYWEWDALNMYNDAAQRSSRQQYLRRKLAAYAVELPEPPPLGGT